MTTPSDLTFKLLRLLADGEFRSGEALAKAVGLSRTTVWKALQCAQACGITLYRVHGRGYRLVTPIDWLDADVIARRLREKARLFDIRIEQALPSTSTALLQDAAAGAPAGTVLAAELQTAGRGRRGRSWFSGLGGALTFSLLWRFERRISALGGRRGVVARPARAGCRAAAGEMAQRCALAAPEGGRHPGRSGG
jgi:BirA family biotin operon repressor/biotin-[acetyl-CoA-carboxylase] ligase